MPAVPFIGASENVQTIWNKRTGDAIECESVDAREILAKSPDLYSATDPVADAAPVVVVAPPPVAPPPPANQKR